jgi:hypothetical protein
MVSEDQSFAVEIYELFSSEKEFGQALDFSSTSTAKVGGVGKCILGAPSSKHMCYGSIIAARNFLFNYPLILCNSIRNGAVTSITNRVRQNRSAIGIYDYDYLHVFRCLEPNQPCNELFSRGNFL